MHKTFSNFTLIEYDKSVYLKLNGFSFFKGFFQSTMDKFRRKLLLIR